MPSDRPSIADKRRSFRALHQSGCFVIPNPWNVGSARYLQAMGFKALATTSSGHAHSLGYADGAQSRDDVLAHFRELAAATNVPLNADFENGFADDPDGVAANVTRCIETGVAGLSIEDFAERFQHATLRFRSRAGSGQGGACRDRQGWRRRGFYRAHRRLYPRPARPARRPSAGSRRLPKPAPIASIRQASRPASRSKQR